MLTFIKDLIRFNPYKKNVFFIHVTVSIVWVISSNTDNDFFLNVSLTVQYFLQFYWSIFKRDRWPFLDCTDLLQKKNFIVKYWFFENTYLIWEMLIHVPNQNIS